jgi:hypothetical protein
MPTITEVLKAESFEIIAYKVNAVEICCSENYT